MHEDLHFYSLTLSAGPRLRRRTHPVPLRLHPQISALIAPAPIHDADAALAKTDAARMKGSLLSPQALEQRRTRTRELVLVEEREVGAH